MANEKERKTWIGKIFSDLTKEDFREIMAALALVAGFVYMFLITFLPVPGEFNQRNADIILGMVGSMVFGRVFAYYFDKEPKAPKDNTPNEIEGGQ